MQWYCTPTNARYLYLYPTLNPDSDACVELQRHGLRFMHHARLQARVSNHNPDPDPNPDPFTVLSFFKLWSSNSNSNPNPTLALLVMAVFHLCPLLTLGY